MGTPVVPYNFLDEPGPLGLRLRKSPSLLDLIQMRLSRPDAATAASGMVTSESIEKKEIMPPLAPPPSPAPSTHKPSDSSLSDVSVPNTLIPIYAFNYISTAQLFDQTPSPDLVSYNTLIDVYAKIRDMATTCELFASMPNRDVISWGTLLAGYSHTGCFTDALQLFDQMVATGLKPDAIAIVCALSCCGQLWKIEREKAILEYLVRNRGMLNVYLSTGLVDMYAKCTRIGLVREMFKSSRYWNLFTWNMIIIGLGMHGHGELALEYFGRMVGTGVRPVGVSFVGVFVGCSHGGTC